MRVSRAVACLSMDLRNGFIHVGGQRLGVRGDDKLLRWWYRPQHQHHARKVDGATCAKHIRIGWTRWTTTIHHWRPPD